MNGIQMLAITVVLACTAPMAHAAKAAGMGSDVLSSDAYTQEAAAPGDAPPGTTGDDGSQPGVSSPGAHASGDNAASDTGNAKLPTGTSSGSPHARTPSWQSLLPGSIQ